MKNKLVILLLSSIVMLGGCQQSKVTEDIKEVQALEEVIAQIESTYVAETVIEESTEIESSTESINVGDLVLEEESTVTESSEVLKLPEKPGYQNKKDLKEYIEGLINDCTFGELEKDRTSVITNYATYDVFDEKHKSTVEDNKFVKGTFEIIPMGTAGMPTGIYQDPEFNNLVTPITYDYTISPKFDKDLESYETSFYNNDEKEGMYHSVLTSDVATVRIVNNNCLEINSEAGNKYAVSMCLNNTESDYYSFGFTTECAENVKVVKTNDGLEVYSKEPCVITATAHNRDFNEVIKEGIKIDGQGVFISVNSRDKIVVEELEDYYETVF